MIMFIHFFCLCPLSLAIKLNFNISKVAYCCIVYGQASNVSLLVGHDIIEPNSFEFLRNLPIEVAAIHLSSL